MNAETQSSSVIDLTGIPEPVVQSIRQLVESIRNGTGPAKHEDPVPKPERKPLMGRFAHLGLSIPKEHIDEAQREVWGSFQPDKSTEAKS